MAARKRIGELLLEAGVIDRFQLESALVHQRQWGGPLGRILVDNGFVSEALLMKSLASQLRLPLLNLDQQHIHEKVIEQLPADLAETYNVIPVRVQFQEGRGSILFLAMADPTNVEAIDAVQFRTGKRVSPVLAPEGQLERAIRRHYHGEAQYSSEEGYGNAQFAGTELELEDTGPKYRPAMLSQSGVPLAALKGPRNEEEPIPVVTGAIVEDKPSGSGPAAPAPAAPEPRATVAPLGWGPSGDAGPDEGDESAPLDLGAIATPLDDVPLELSLDDMQPAAVPTAPLIPLRPDDEPVQVASLPLENIETLPASALIPIGDQPPADDAGPAVAGDIVFEGVPGALPPGTHDPQIEQRDQDAPLDAPASLVLTPVEPDTPAPSPPLDEGPGTDPGDEDLLPPPGAVAIHIPSDEEPIPERPAEPSIVIAPDLSEPPPKRAPASVSVVAESEIRQPGALTGPADGPSIVVDDALSNPPAPSPVGPPRAETYDVDVGPSPFDGPGTDGGGPDALPDASAFIESASDEAEPVVEPAPPDPEPAPAAVDDEPPAPPVLAADPAPGGLRPLPNTGETPAAPGGDPLPGMPEASSDEDLGVDVDVDADEDEDDDQDAGATPLSAADLASLGLGTFGSVPPTPAPAPASDDLAAAGISTQPTLSSSTDERIPALEQGGSLGAAPPAALSGAEIPAFEQGPSSHPDDEPASPVEAPPPPAAQAPAALPPLPPPPAPAPAPAVAMVPAAEAAAFPILDHERGAPAALTGAARVDDVAVLRIPGTSGFDATLGMIAQVASGWAMAADDTDVPNGKASADLPPLRAGWSTSSFAAVDAPEKLRVRPGGPVAFEATRQVVPVNAESLEGLEEVSRLRQQMERAISFAPGAAAARVEPVHDYVPSTQRALRGGAPPWAEIDAVGGGLSVPHTAPMFTESDTGEASDDEGAVPAPPAFEPFPTPGTTQLMPVPGGAPPASDEGGAVPAPPPLDEPVPTPPPLGLDEAPAGPDDDDDVGLYDDEDHDPHAVTPYSAVPRALTLDVDGPITGADADESEEDLDAEANAFEHVTPTSITRLSPAQLRKLAARMIERGDLTGADVEAATTDDDD